MRRCLLATLALLCTCSLGRAEYILIVVNLNAGQRTTTPGTALGGATGMIGFPGGAAGVPGGAAIGRPPGAMIGRPPGANFGGATGVPPGVNIGGATGVPPGAMTGVPPGAMIGVPPGGLNMGRPPGAATGMMPPGANAGGGFGFLGGIISRPAAPRDADDDPDLIVGVLEVDSRTANFAKTFNKGLQPVRFDHKWGQILLFRKQPQYEVIVLEQTKGVPYASVSKRFQARWEKAFKEKTSTESVLKDVALWALEHGLTDECARTMDKLAETDKTHTAVKAYLEVKAALARPLVKEDVSTRVKSKHLAGYQITQDDKHHYALIHPKAMENVTPQLDRLERNLRNYYYWWALRGIVLPVPKERLLAVITEQNDHFNRLKKHYTASPVLTDSFTARREGVAVYASKRGDAVYDKLTKVSKPLWDAGFDRTELITGKQRKGIPKGVANEAAHGPRTTALLLKILENEWEQTGMSHETSRQLLFASGLLPRNVNVPEWLQFGMASLFEAPLQSPWPTVGAANPYWLPRFREFNRGKDPSKKYEASPYKTLVKVVTDSYFREKPPLELRLGEKPADRASREQAAREVQLRKARAAAWSLTYFLARQHLPSLQRYFKELSRMPRDIELDEKTLLACFQRAFAGEDLTRLANRWVSFINNEQLEAAAVHEKIREIYAQMTKAPPSTGGIGVNPGGRPGFPGGFVPPGGVRPPGGGVRPPGGGPRPRGR